MAFEQIKILLNEKIGLAPDSISDSSIERALIFRISELNLSGYDNYYRRITNDSRELRELVEEVAVPETWFFRNDTPFQFFKQYLLEDILPNKQKNKKIRILSIPCSTGEEPYSIAIAVNEAGVGARDIEIDAVDISRRGISKAKAALYSNNSFRNIDQDLVDKYFDKIASGFKLKCFIRKQVKFKQGNILVGSLGPHPGYYDIIFCRNLLIYFDKKNQLLTQEKLCRTLKKAGLLFVGHAETVQISSEYFVPKADAESFSFQKKYIENNCL